MSERPEYETQKDAERRGMPRWVRLSLIVGGIVIVVLVVMMLIGGGHGPARHTGGLGGGPVSSSISAGLAGAPVLLTGGRE